MSYINTEDYPGINASSVFALRSASNNMEDVWAANDLSIDRSIREQWASIPGSKWTVSSYGRVRTSRGTEAFIDTTRSGFARIKVPTDGNPKWVYLNQLVLILFGERVDLSDGLVPLHKDDNPMNCRLDNLTWVRFKSIDTMIEELEHEQG